MLVILILQNVPEILKLAIILWDFLKMLIKLIFEIFNPIQDTRISEIQTFLNKTKYVIEDFFINTLLVIKITVYIWIFAATAIIDYIIDALICDWNYKITTFFRSIIVWCEIDFINFFTRYDDQFICKLRETYKLAAHFGVSDIIDKNNYQTLELFEGYVEDDIIKYEKLQLISCCIALAMLITLGITLSR